MRGWFSAVPWRRREAGHADAALTLIASLALLLAFPAAKPYMEAEIDLRGLDIVRAS